MYRKMTGALLMALALVLATAAFAQEKGKKPEGKAPAMTPEMQAAMEKMQKAATPGAPHKLLAEMEGTWKAEVKSWMDPKTPPEVSQGTSENKMILGGRFLKQTFKSSFMGQPFDGVGITGYDNVLKRYQGVWIDSMGTTMTTSVGEADAAGKTITSTMTYSDCQTGKVQTSRDVIKILGKDKHVMEMYGPGPDGKEYLMMEITYTRVPG